MKPPEGIGRQAKGAEPRSLYVVVLWSLTKNLAIAPGSTGFRHSEPFFYHEVHPCLHPTDRPDEQPGAATAVQ